MTDVINFFQSIFMFKDSAAGSLSRQEVELIKSLKSEAQSLAAIADAEMRNGQMTRDLAFDAGEKEKNRVFAEIAVWHTTRAAEKYRKSAERFEEAGKVQITKRKAFNLIAKEMSQRAAEAEAVVVSLNDFLAQTLTK